MFSININSQITESKISNSVFRKVSLVPLLTPWNNILQFYRDTSVLVLFHNFQSVQKIK